MRMKVYDNPLYYEVAFSFFNPKKQVDHFEDIIRRFSRIKVERFLDIACGPSLQLRELARRGYEAVGLDKRRRMLQYLQSKAREEGLRIETVQADMTRFRLRRKADFAFIMMGSFSFKSNEDLLKHLNSVANSLNSGGLYFIQNFGVNWKVDWTKVQRQTWEMEKNGVKVEATYEIVVKNVVNQTIMEKIIIEVDDRGKKRTLMQEEELKLVFPQEFKLLVKMNGRFEFLGWWKGDVDEWYLDQPLETVCDENININMVLLRRK
ncbi:MAG: class I SAM-dependent methyltransferase [Candidatus Bathyarchaeia archaeon]